jgi:hypothetical protein
MTDRPPVATLRLKAGAAAVSMVPANVGRATNGRQKLLSSTLFDDPLAAANFLSNILEASTEYSIIGKDLDGTIELWNEGARRL